MKSLDLRGALLVVVCLLPVNAAQPAPETVPVGDPDKLQLTYEGFIAGINAGSAQLVLERSPLPIAGEFSYQVSGSARSKGLWESIQQWRAEYSVTGQVKAESVVIPGHFYSLQTTPKKRREIHIEDGILRETKNNKVRDPRPAQTGYDLLSAMFFLPTCHESARVHTGRDGYELRRRKNKGSANCSYTVTDADGGQYTMSLTYENRRGFTVPVSIDVQGPLSGRMVLADQR